MKEFSVKQALVACGGKFFGSEDLLEKSIKGVAIDNRKIEQDFLFVPIKGERFDGHSFIKSAFENGAVITLSEKTLENLPYILVEDSLAAFQNIAEWYKSRFSAKTVGITGSVGKTTTKEMVASVLSVAFDTMYSKGNLNNQTGVPQNIFMLEERHKAAVIEMGTNHFGEIDSLAKMVKPDICLLTNIGQCHIEFLGSRDGILKAKTEMLPHMKEGGSVVVNGDDDKLCTLKSQRKDVITFGIESDCDIKAQNIVDNGLDGSEFTVDGEKYTVPSPGRHMIYNALACIAVGRLFKMTPAQIKEGLINYKPISGRMNIVHTGKITILDDVYNANPNSMRSALDVLAYAKGRKIAVLGDMFELGEKEAEYHCSVGEYAKDKADIVLCVGALSENTAKGAGDKGVHFKTQDELIAALPNIIKEGDSVVVKASHSMRLENTVEALKNL